MAKKYFNVDVETSGDVSAADVTASGNISAVDVTATGDVSAYDIDATGNITSIKDMSAKDINASGTVAAASVIATGNVSAVDVTASGDITAVDVTASGDISTTGGDVLVVQGNIEVSNGGIAAMAGSVMALALSASGTGASITTTGPITAGGLVKADLGLEVDGATTLTGAVGVTGDTTLTGAVEVTGDITLTGALDVSDASITADAVFKVKVDDTSNSSELHLTPQYLKLAVADPQSQSSFYVNSSSGDVLTTGTVTTYDKLTVNDEAVVTGNLTAGGIHITSKSIQDPAEDANLITFDGYHIKLPQISVENNNSNDNIEDTPDTTETHDLVIHASGTNPTYRVYRAISDVFTGTHNYIGVETGLTVGDVVGLQDNKVVHVGPNSTVAVGILAYVSKDAVIRTSLGETELPEGHKIYCTASVGDSRHKGCQGFNVCNEAGDINPGDLLVTSSTPGYLMKQDDDIIRSKTVGKAMEAVTFDANGQATGIYGYIYCG